MFILLQVFIHGGAYRNGQGMLYDGSALTAHGDVILVTINYRLELLGFMSTGDATSPGNYGLWDQHMALQWVHNNIKSFGGDTKRVTIFGESAGAFSVSLQSMYPSNAGLFQRVMSESGTANSKFALGYNNSQYSRYIGDILGCNQLSNAAYVKCMRTKSYEDILNATTVSSEVHFDHKIHIAVVYAPVIDGDFLKGDPDTILTNSSALETKFFRSLDFAVGTMNCEGSLLIDIMKIYQKIYSFNVSEGIPRQVVCDGVIDQLAIDWFHGNTAVSKAICDRYEPTSASTLSQQSQGVVNMFSDFFFLAPSIHMLDVHSGGRTNKSTYEFVLTRYEGTFGYSAPYPSWFQGPGHFADMAYLFFIPINPGLNDSNVDVILSRQMITYWTNFAITG